MSNLMLRILTAFILLPFVSVAVFLLPAYYFPFFSATVLLLAAWEWSRLVGCHRWYQQLGYVLLVGNCFVLASYLPSFVVLGFGVIMWVLATFFVFYCTKKKTVASFPLCYGMMGLGILPASWESINFLGLAEPRPYLLCLVFLIVWTADTVAYFVGRRWGKHKLAPAVSPGKTVEGALGAFCGVIVLMVIIALARDLTLKQSLHFIVLGCLVLFASIVGDLFESLMKRARGVKDSSQLLPGHGGILDRLDSLIAAGPVCALSVLLVGLI